MYCSSFLQVRHDVQNLSLASVKVLNHQAATPRAIQAEKERASLAQRERERERDTETVRKLALQPFFFPSQNMIVAADPNLQRDHIVVVGPESSGTTFMLSTVHAALFPQTAEMKTDRHTWGPRAWSILPSAAIYHISLPESHHCETQTSEPIFLDFGPSPETEMDYLVERPTSPPKSLPRFFINISSVVQAYRARRERVTVFQVARNPGFTLKSKASHQHCSLKDKTKAEQRLAFALMLEAMDMPEVTTVCYEEILGGGEIYLRGKLAMQDIRPAGNVSLPAVGPRADDTQLIADIECNEDVEAYVTLCPTSPDTAFFQERCSKHARRA